MDDEIAEFEALLNFLQRDLPKVFAKRAKGGEEIVVAQSYNGDLIASFLIRHDQFSSVVPREIQNFLCKLSLPWRVIGSFDIHEPISQSGDITPSPYFEVTSKEIVGNLDMAVLRRRWGARLVSGK